MIAREQERQADAQASAARANRLRLAWEEFSKSSQALDVSPQTAARAMEYQASHNCTWPEALQAVGQSDFTEDDLKAAQDLMHHEPKLTWPQAYKRVKGRYPD